jgi:hypothetical protein
MSEEMPIACNVATWYEYPNLWTASCVSFINTAIKIQHIKILTDMPSHLITHLPYSSSVLWFMESQLPARVLLLHSRKVSQSSQPPYFDHFQYIWFIM